MATPQLISNSGLPSFMNQRQKPRGQLEDIATLPIFVGGDVVISDSGIPSSINQRQRLLGLLKDTASRSGVAKDEENADHFLDVLLGAHASTGLVLIYETQ